MNINFVLVLINLIYLNLNLVRTDNNNEEALSQCASLHRIEIHNIPNSNALFENSKCLLHCFVGDKTLASDAINEGSVCPLDSSGICRNGKCIGSQDDALRSCGELHKMDFHKVNNAGTVYLNNSCTLRCMIDGNVMSTSANNEGSPCPSNRNGICHNGICVLINHNSSTAKPTTTTVPQPTRLTTQSKATQTKATTTSSPPTTIPPSALSKYQINEFELEIVSSNYSSDNQNLKFEVDVCVYNSADHSFLWSECNQFCISPLIFSSGFKNWTIKCFTMNEGFSDRSTLFMAMLNHNVNVGENKQNLFDLFNQSINQQHSLGVLSFEKDFPILSHNTNVGFVKLNLKFKFSIKK